MKSSVYLLAFLLAGSLSAMASADPTFPKYAPQVGKLHPDFTLKKIDANSNGQQEFVSLTQFRGSKVLLMHFASW